MTSETNQEAGAQAIESAGEGEQAQVETISIPKTEWEKTQQTLGSLKRDLKAATKPKEKEESTETSTTNQPEPSFVRELQELALAAAGITDDEEVELTLETAKKWGVPVKQLLKDDDFTAKLDKHRTKKANIAATSDVKGGAGGSQAKLSADYWIAKGQPPTPADVPDRKTRASIVRAMMSSGEKGGKFYNS